MYVDITGNLVVQMPDVDASCPNCKAKFTVDGEDFKDLFLEPLASAECRCEQCGNEFYVHIKE